jgi:hypothetical protein
LQTLGDIGVLVLEFAVLLRNWKVISNFDP